MITVTAYFVVYCYTTTIASCQTIAGLPSAQVCTEIVDKIKAKRKTVRLEMCDSYSMLMVSQTGTMPSNVLIAK